MMNTKLKLTDGEKELNNQNSMLNKIIIES